MRDSILLARASVEVYWLNYLCASAGELEVDFVGASLDRFN